MMSRIRRMGWRIALSGLVSASMPTYADTTQEIFEEDVISQPSYGHSLADGLVARPLMLAGTVGGAAVFLATLPFSIMGENVKGAANSLVVNPALLTFRRCLGCTVKQDELKNQIRAAEAQQVQANAVKTLWHWPNWVYRHRPVAVSSATTTTISTPAATDVNGSVVQVVMQ